MGGVYRGYIGIMKENGNYYLGFRGLGFRASSQCFLMVHVQNLRI